MNFIRKIINKTTSGPYWVMYDNECSFCYRITRFFKTFDMFDKIQWIDKDWKGSFPDEGRAKIKDTVVVFNPSNNKLYYKSKAVSKIIDDSGNEVPAGTEGHIACKRPDPVMLLEYLNKPEATKEKFIGDWLITGDVGHMDEEGYFWFHGRGDDVITSSGYRIGPGEIEDALLKHDAVQMSAVVGVPDPVRTEVIKAFIILKEGFSFLIICLI